MGKLLIVVATDKEIAPLRENVLSQDLDILISGVGMINTAIALTEQLLNREEPDLIINAGIAGAFDREIEIGTVVQVIEDRFSELGVQDGNKFVPADGVGLVHPEDLVYKTDQRVDSLKTARGITVNTVHGNQKSIEEIKALLDPDVESMEGAAVAAVAEKSGIPWLQIRSISNHVEPRDTSKWNIPLAIENLNWKLQEVLEELQ